MNTNLNINRRLVYRVSALVALIIALTAISSQTRADTGTCNGASITVPFTDVPTSNIFFCSIAAAYFAGLTNGTSPTTYSPAAPVPREQMSAFITRTLDQSLRRGNRRAAAQQWWRPANVSALCSTDVGDNPLKIAWDGADLWVANNGGDTVSRVRASDGKRTQTWQLAFNPRDVIVAAGSVFVTGVMGPSTPGRVYRIDPRQDGSPVSVEVFENNTGPDPVGITFDGQRLWTANNTGGGSITRIALSTAIENTFTTGFLSPSDILWDGENLWVADSGAGNVKRVDPSNGFVLEFIQLGGSPAELLFDGANLWVSNPSADSISVIRAVGSLRGTVLETITGNGLAAPRGMAFDGERVLVTNNILLGSVSLFKAADFSPLGNVFAGVNSEPFAACSDGLNFWITRPGLDDVVRY